jgi:DNA-binding transcriptional LysR family regulator
MQGRMRAKSAPIDPQTLRWDDLKLFLALRKHGSLAAGGAAMGIDSSTASRRLATLEKTLSVQLFMRSRDGLTATAYAEQLTPFAEAMAGAAANFLHGADTLERDVQGVVRLSCPPGLIDAFIVPRLPELRAKYPGIVMELDARIAVADISRREADIALRVLRPVGNDLIAQQIFATSAVVAGSPSYVKALGRLQTWKAAEFIAWGQELAHIPHAQWISKYIPRSQVALVTSSFSTQIAAAKLGLGLVVVPMPYLAAHDLVQARVGKALLPATEALPEDQLWLVTHTALRQVPRVAAVWQCVQSWFSEYRMATK